MLRAEGSFYVTGGSLRSETPSYVERYADEDLYHGLRQGEFCYVLTSRQMGKSSLMVRTAHRLRAEGVAVAILDLTAVGQNLGAEQWYYGLLGRLGEQLRLEDEVDRFWFAHERLGPLQRWIKTLREVVLPRTAGPVVVCLDEIDAVRSLPFSTDELFAAIRECYNRRTEDAAFDNLTFCLLGVAAPTDLIRDTRLTPFNIGRRIELADFTGAEAAPLSIGLEVGELGAPGRQEQQARSLLKRILYWTGGHPYLTQRLCQAVAADASVSGPRDVDHVCQGLFLSHRAQERDDNLIFVRERLLRGDPGHLSPGEALTELLELYRRVWEGRPVSVEDTNPLVERLRLAGIARVADGARRPWPGRHGSSALVVRNRIYARVFDGEWIAQHMPDAEVRRQRAAYRRGLLRATAGAAVVLAVMGALALSATRSARRAEVQRVLLRRNLYASDMSAAQQALEGGNLERARQLLQAHYPTPGQEDLRGFEWRWLWMRSRGEERHTFRAHGRYVWAAAYSPDGRTIATVGADGTVRLWDTASCRETALLPGHGTHSLDAAFSPDGRLLATTGFDGIVRLWSVGERREVGRLTGHRGWVYKVVFSPDGRTLASAGDDCVIRLWDVGGRSLRQVLPGHAHWAFELAFSPAGDLLASAGSDGLAGLWRARHDGVGFEPAGL